MLYDDLVPKGIWLCHHGIKGQKWGIKNGPPYPINDSYFYLPSKTKMFRSSTSKTSFTDGRKYTYVNITDEYYNHAMSVGEGFDGRFKYDLCIESTKKLKMAKLDMFLDTLFDVIGADKKIMSKRSAAEILCDDKLIPHEYKEGDLYGGTKTNPVFLKVIDELIKKGYDGVEDPVDAATARKNNDMYAIAAIIFNPSDKLQITDVYEL